MITASIVALWFRHPLLLCGLPIFLTTINLVLYTKLMVVSSTSLCTKKPYGIPNGPHFPSKSCKACELISCFITSFTHFRECPLPIGWTRWETGISIPKKRVKKTPTIIDQSNKHQKDQTCPLSKQNSILSIILESYKFGHQTKGPA